MDLGSSYCGWRPVLCWFRYLPISESAPGYSDIVRNVFGTLPVSQNTNDPWLEQPGGQHIFQNTQAVEAGQFPPTLIREVYNTAPNGGISIAQFRDASANSNAKKA
ncbi:uncharacterized protein N7511_003544 [Penicillium nucicola]|uniref:uncharacterized protein n=1 Tax=Penicillium nucicola TaxID=1850975 RepID=UPI0025450A65|nr:uncharacterized protein N7511_003544 [Penicillium nucicola]KAJ5771493.1 hypothetical protein N7511_003544 [Penicillium nucicola]